MKIGFIGLGSMGSAIARNIVKAGHEVIVWNRSPESALELAEAGALVAKRPEDALHVDVLFSMLANDKAIHDVGLDGPLLAHASPDLIHANLSTISVAFAKALADQHATRGVGYVAAPVFGRPDVAAAGELTVIAAGKSEHIAKLRPMFDVIGRRAVIVGEAPEQANLFKVAGNFMIASVIESFGEALALVRKGNVDPSVFYDVMTTGLFAAPVYKGYGKLIVEEKYEPAGFALRLGLKDVDLALAAGSERAVPMPLAKLLHDQFVEAMGSGLGEKDWSALAGLIARNAGLHSAAFDRERIPSG
jgi:3-hydroxyisobutyrate dehydrogenase-like beta-hydroxyacid dehydrogenase